MAGVVTILRTGIKAKRDAVLRADFLQIDCLLMGPSAVIYKVGERRICSLVVSGEKSLIDASCSILLYFRLELVGDFWRLTSGEEHQRHCMFQVTQHLLVHVGIR